MRCGACGREGVRTTSLAYVATSEGLRQKRVCQRCAKAAVTIVPMMAEHTCQADGGCGNAPWLCLAHVTDRIARERAATAAKGPDVAILKRTLARYFRGGAEDDEYTEGIRAGLALAIDLLTRTPGEVDAKAMPVLDSLLGEIAGGGPDA